MDIQTAIAVQKIKQEEAALPREFLLKRIENEISAGFVFVEAARRAFKLSQTNAAEGALDQAAVAHQVIAKEVDESPAAQVRNVIHQLSELREAIDWIRFHQFEQQPRPDRAGMDEHVR